MREQVVTHEWRARERKVPDGNDPPRTPIPRPRTRTKLEGSKRRKERSRAWPRPQNHVRQLFCIVICFSDVRKACADVNLLQHARFALQTPLQFFYLFVCFFVCCETNIVVFHFSVTPLLRTWNGSEMNSVKN